MARPKPPGHGDPTALQREAWETVQRLVTQKAAAEHLGIHQGTLQSRMQGYAHAMGITGPLPGARQYARGKRGTGQIATLRAEIATLQEQLAAANAALEAEQRAHEAAIHGLLERVADLHAQAHPWIAVHAKLDAIMARPFGAPVVTHRRRADGGAGGKREHRGEVAA